MELIETKQDKKQRLLEKAGITDKLVFEKLRARLDAKKNIRDRYGEVVDTEDDGPAIDAALDKILKLKGYLADDKGITNVMNVDADMSKMILEATRKAIKESKG